MAHSSTQLATAGVPLPGLEIDGVPLPPPPTNTMDCFRTVYVPHERPFLKGDLIRRIFHIPQKRSRAAVLWGVGGLEPK